MLKNIVGFPHDVPASMKIGDVVVDDSGRVAIRFHTRESMSKEEKVVANQNTSPISLCLTPAPCDDPFVDKAGHHRLPYDWLIVGRGIPFVFERRPTFDHFDGYGGGDIT